MNFNRRAIVWLAAIIVVVNGFFPAVWILLTSLKTETELIKVPITYLPEAPTLDELRDGVHRAADPALHVEQRRRRRRCRRRCACFVGALAAYALTRLRMPAPQPHHVGAARGRDVPADLADGAAVQADARSSACSTPTSR